MVDQLCEVYRGLILKQLDMGRFLGGDVTLFDPETHRIFEMICKLIGAIPDDYAYDRLSDYVDGRIDLIDAVEAIKAVNIVD
ncbi:hypothetical protein NYE48_27840 [Paenibacillus sp. FSL M7-1455]|uniref:hypothetical protein n=1 Tax=Paenibacillus sp. FSL M7-1455 TaxID=2975316 RepID=UPI0030F6E7EE